MALDCAAQGKRLGKCDRSIVAGSNLSLGFNASFSMSIGALIIRIRFLGPLYYI